MEIDNYKYERELREKGITLIAGVDEVGRGPLVGPDTKEKEKTAYCSFSK